MSRFRRARRERTPHGDRLDLAHWALPLGACATATWAGAIAHPIAGAALGLTTAALGALWTQHRARHAAAAPADVDLELVRLGLRTSRQASDEELRIIRNAAHSVRESVGQTLHLVRSALRARTAVVLWVNSARGSARVRVADTSHPGEIGGSFDDDAGVLARLARHRDPVIVNRMDADRSGLPWYGEATGGHVVGIALAREGVRLGYLVVDRALDDTPFDDADAEAVVAAAEQVALAIRMEQLVVEAAHVRREMAMIDAAAARLNAALTVDEVCREAAALVGELLPFHACAITAFDEAAGEQRVLYAQGGGLESTVGLRFGDDESVASKALQRLEVMPYSARWEDADAPVVGDAPVTGTRSLLAFPLAMGRRRIGTFVAAHRVEGAYEQLGRARVDTMLHHVAAALSNALAYHDMLTRATTDGMTGLTNHRTFKELATLAVARARRSGRPLTLLMTDIDHFKSVNDTHGHAVGDEVIKGVADVLARSHRDVDIAARYGGEEFAVLLEDTELEAAVQMAERVRSHVAELQFEGADGPFSVTLSLGVARFAPEEMSLAELIDAADQALYGAKRGGRDQVVRYDDLDADAA